MVQAPPPPAEEPKNDGRLAPTDQPPLPQRRPKRKAAAPVKLTPPIDEKGKEKEKEKAKASEQTTAQQEPAEKPADSKPAKQEKQPKTTEPASGTEPIKAAAKAAEPAPTPSPETTQPEKETPSQQTPAALQTADAGQAEPAPTREEIPIKVIAPDDPEPDVKTEPEADTDTETDTGDYDDDNGVPEPQSIASANITGLSEREEAPVNTSAVPEKSPFVGGKQNIEKTLPVAEAPVTLRALITEAGKGIKSGLIWRIYRFKKGSREEFSLIDTLETPIVQTKLAPGAYMVNIAWGRAQLSEMVEVLSSQPFSRDLVLNAGGLRLGARQATGAPIPTNLVTYSIYSDERDQFGKRQLLVENAPAGKIIRLNAGIYHIKSQYGTVNGLVETDITVEAGKLTEAIINHTATKVTLKLVNQPGGEALAGALWRILSPEGKLIKTTGGALPTQVLAAGDYTIQAQYAGRTFARKVSIEPGTPVYVEIVIQ
jgi:hypothetical protein